jgi:hypothetical protein
MRFAYPPGYGLHRNYLCQKAFFLAQMLSDPEDFMGCDAIHGVYSSPAPWLPIMGNPVSRHVAWHLEQDQPQLLLDVGPGTGLGPSVVKALRTTEDTERTEEEQRTS